jgi:hypothetical protein
MADPVSGDHRPGESRDPDRGIFLWPSVVDVLRKTKSWGYGSRIGARYRSLVRDDLERCRMTAKTCAHVLATAFARALHQHHPRKMPRAQGRPGARCTRGRFAQERCARARRPQVQAETLRPSLRSGLRLIRALPGEPSRLPPSSARCASIVANLAPRHWGARTTRLRRPRMAPLVSRRRPRPPHPASRFVTTRTPLVSRQDTRTIRLILPSEKRKYFLRQGLTRFRRRRSTGKSMHKPGANSWGSAKP